MNAAIPICIFAKSPRPGQVKTRLAGAMGVRRAAELADAFLCDTLAQVQFLPWARPIAVIAGDLEPAMIAQDIEVWPQGEGTLGQRLERGLRRALSRGGTAVAIGADTPGLPRSLFEDARRALSYADAVLGPSNDGGFYLLGLRRCPEGLFDDVRWSDPNTGDDMRARLRHFGLHTEIIEPWFDVDRPQDLDRLTLLLERNALHAPCTARVLFSKPRTAAQGNAS